MTGTSQMLMVVAALAWVAISTVVGAALSRRDRSLSGPGAAIRREA